MTAGTDGNVVVDKPGAEVLTRWVTTKYKNPPCYVTWKIGKGRTYAVTHDWTPAGGWEMSRWDYYRDYAINLMLYLAKKPLPPDYLTAHDYREQLHYLATNRGLLLSLIDFVESFGGNARPIDGAIISMDEVVAEARIYYLEYDFQGALEATETTVGKMKDIEELSVRVKNEARFWVYLVEWLSVTAVSLLSGILLWSLMVRRSLYREVEATRLGRSHGS